MAQANSTKEEKIPNDCTLATRTTSLHSFSHSNTPGVTGCWGLCSKGWLCRAAGEGGGGKGGGGGPQHPCSEHGSVHDSKHHQMSFKVVMERACRPCGARTRRAVHHATRG